MTPASTDQFNEVVAIMLAEVQTVAEFYEYPINEAARNRYRSQADAIVRVVQRRETNSCPDGHVLDWDFMCTRCGVFDSAEALKVLKEQRDEINELRAVEQRIPEVERAAAEKAWDDACRSTEQYYKRTVVGMPGIDPVDPPVNPYREGKR